MSRNSVKQLLMTSNFYVLNKQLVKKLGIETAFFLTALVEADEMLADEDGWFYQKSETLQELTGLSNFKQTSLINQLIKLGVLQQKNKGVPCRRHFKISFEEIENLLFEKLENQFSKNLKTSFEEIENLDCEKFENKISKNSKTIYKKNNINNIDKKLNIKKVSSTDNAPVEKEELKAKIDEYKTLVSKATGKEKAKIDLVLKPYVYMPHLDQLLEKIKASKFLLGEKEQKPSLRIFAYKTNEIIAGIYDDFENKETAETKKTKTRNFNPDNPYDTRTPEQIEKDRREQEEFERAIGIL